jgi:membrane fusion protein, multidrug efflux system
MPAVTDTALRWFARSPKESRGHYPLQKFTAAVILAASALAVMAGCSKPEPAASTIRPALAYKIPAGAGMDTEVYAGEIRARVESDHAFRVNGKIAQRLVDSGAAVKKGQPLARLDPQDVRLAAESARAQVAALQTEADFADAELKRFRDLFAKNFVSQSALDQKINVAGAAKARLAAQRAQASVTANQAGYATLVAETDGVVTQVMAEAGQVVAAGQAVMKIANPRDKELSISVPEVKLPEFKAALKDAANRKLNVALWAQPKQYYPAVIREISGAADNVTRTYAVRLSLEKPDDAVQLGMTAYAVFASTNEAGTMSVPLSALYVKGSVTGVWQIAADNSVTLKPVTVIQYRETSAFIRAEATSVKPGDMIVAAGVHKLRAGEVIRPITDATITGDGKVAYAPGSVPAENATAIATPSR